MDSTGAPARRLAPVYPPIESSGFRFGAHERIRLLHWLAVLDYECHGSVRRTGDVGRDARKRVAHHVSRLVSGVVRLDHAAALGLVRGAGSLGWTLCVGSLRARPYLCTAGRVPMGVARLQPGDHFANSPTGKPGWSVRGVGPRSRREQRSGVLRGTHLAPGSKPPDGRHDDGADNPGARDLGKPARREE